MTHKKKPKIHLNNRKSSVPALQQTYYVSIENINWLKLFREIHVIVVCSEYHTKHLNMLNHTVDIVATVLYMVKPLLLLLFLMLMHNAVSSA
jgi:hypothetical protein